MADTGEITDSRLQSWLNAERWFMRYLGSALLVIAALSVFSGIFSNPVGETIIRVFNIAITILLAVAGIWTILSSNNDCRRNNHSSIQYRHHNSTGSRRYLDNLIIKQ